MSGVHEWNIIHGCTKISDGCKHCPVDMSPVLVDGLEWPNRGGGGFYILNRQSDTFHDLIPNKTLERVFEIMWAHPEQKYMILTKRTKRLVEFASQIKGLSNLALGVSVENNKALERVADLKMIEGVFRYVYFAPLLEEIDLAPDTLDGIDYVTVSPEYGIGKRPFQVDFMRQIVFYAALKEIPLNLHSQDFNSSLLFALDAVSGKHPGRRVDELPPLQEAMKNKGDSQ